MKTRPHVFVPDPALRSDWRGRRYCSQCPLPEDNKVHTQAPEPDASEARRVGEVQEA